MKLIVNKTVNPKTQYKTLYSPKTEEGHTKNILSDGGKVEPQHACKHLLHPL